MPVAFLKIPIGNELGERCLEAAICYSAEKERTSASLLRFL